MSEYTKGKWKTSGRTVQVGNRNIASIWAKKRKGEADANARLIAAVPNLLEACEASQKWLGGKMAISKTDGFHTNAEYAKKHNALVDKIEAAIAKAKQ